MSDVPFVVCARWQAELLEAKAAKDDPTLYAYDDVYESFSECHAFPLRSLPAARALSTLPQCSAYIACDFRLGAH
jgi:hypothetical protein